MGFAWWWCTNQQWCRHSKVQRARFWECRDQQSRSCTKCGEASRQKIQGGGRRRRGRGAHFKLKWQNLWLAATAHLQQLQVQVEGEVEECGRLERLMRLPLWREVREATKCSTVVMKTFDSPNQLDFASSIHISRQSQARSNEERQAEAGAGYKC